MITVILLAFVGFLFGLGGVLIYPGPGLFSICILFPLSPILGVIVGVHIVNFRSARHKFALYRASDYKLAPCTWCYKSGVRKILFVLAFPCQVCRGYGHVLTLAPRRRCAWCDGDRRGREWAILRCRVCDGTGWAYSYTDKN